MTFQFQSLNSILSHDRAQLRTLPGLRNAVGVVLPLVIGIALGNVLDGLAAAIGAQIAGFAGLNGTARRRIRLIVFAGLGMAVTTFIGGLWGGTLLAVLLVTISSFLAGLLVCVSDEAGLIGMWATIALVFISGIHDTPLKSFERGILVLTGALLQTVLLILMEWVNKISPEHQGVSAAFEAVAKYAMDSSRETDLSVAATLLEADIRLADSFMVQNRWEELRLLLDIAESVRIEVIALNGILHSMSDREDVQKSDAFFREMEMVRNAMAHVLRGIASGLHHGVSVSTHETENGTLPSVYEQLHTLKQASRILEGTPWHPASACIENTYDELMRAVYLVNGQKRGIGSRLGEQRIRLTTPKVQSALETIRMNLTFRSSTFRHAIRLSVTIGLAMLFLHFFNLRQSYWLPLTILIILKPEFATTFSRGVGRSVGTLLGALLATLLVAIPDKTHTVEVALLGLALWGMYTFFNYNLVVFSSLLTAEIVVLVSFFENVPPLTTIAFRVIYTVAGGLIAFFAYLVWPTWGHKNLPGAILRLIEEEQLYLHSVLGGSESNGLQKGKAKVYRKRTRLARTNAVNLFHQAMSEPIHYSWKSESTLGLLTGFHRFSDAVLSLESYFAHAKVDVRQNPDVRQFAAYANQCLVEIAAEIEENQASSQGSSPGKNASKNDVLDSVRTFTKQQIREMDIPWDLAAIFIRMEDSIGTMFRMVSA